ncbi:metW, methionine biosynthesis protein MetW [uncultured Caudovirales phage]|uniref:MetW, methionine biosynthesis protein MetW n=1 Tax=uncultured Caudovirales phage TaxID=2100421 RepID=A0A6J5RG28_9CAUD|nr:metW, methionine biosynthesis protein MetW [uncultured Caudovirales phage]
MNKYDFELNMNTDNSNSVILRNIKPSTRVLDIGCAYGRMTKYLKEQLQCTTFIAEIDASAGKVASRWADMFFIGEDGDIENPDFFTNLKACGCDNIDYIIFADVLEHVRFSNSILEQSKKILSKDGSVWISIPNIGHNSVLIDLWNNKFNYTDTGLLDNTHIKFFTEDSIKRIVDNCGFKIVSSYNLINAVDCTEFNNSYFDVPPMVAYLMKNRTNAEVYQFVWELKINE